MSSAESTELASAASDCSPCPDLQVRDRLRVERHRQRVDRPFPYLDPRSELPERKRQAPSAKRSRFSVVQAGQMSRSFVSRVAPLACAARPQPTSTNSTSNRLSAPNARAGSSAGAAGSLTPRRARARTWRSAQPRTRSAHRASRNGPHCRTSTVLRPSGLVGCAFALIHSPTPSVNETDS